MTTTAKEGLSREAAELLRQAHELFRLGYYAAATVAAGVAVERTVQASYAHLREQYPATPDAQSTCYCVNRLRQRRWIDGRTRRLLILVAKRRNRAAHYFQATPLGTLATVWLAERLVADLYAIEPPAELPVACVA